MKWFILPAIVVAGSFLYLFVTTPVMIQSAESRTRDGGPVYNEISWSYENGKEVWSMKQSHGGKDLPKKDWDRLRIIVDDTATFLQLDEKNERIEYRASCFLCHSNGPRAIHPVPGSVSLSDQMRIALFNFRIKLYGRVKANELPQIGSVPFRHAGRISNAPLNLSRCTSCHNEDGFLARGTLTRQNSITIAFMTKEKHMPPLGELSPEEKQYLENFMNGF